MHALHEHLCRQLRDRLARRQIVVWYDSGGAFEQLFEELPVAGAGEGLLSRVRIGDLDVHLARFAGSFFAVRSAVEPLTASARPDPLLVYVPARVPDPHECVLLELEKAGDRYAPTFRRLVSGVLRKHFTDGVVDDLLRPEAVGYQDVADFLEQAEGEGGASRLKLLFRDEPDGLALLARWLADESRDAAIEDKAATGELYALVEARLGLPVEAGTSVPDARARVARYVLVGEFRSDLGCAPPESAAMVPEPSSRERVEAVRRVAERLRSTAADSYVELAVRVEEDLALASAGLDAAALGSIDTFRFEERALLGYCGRLVGDRRYAEALEIVDARRRSFWVDREVPRQAQWECCRLLAELGLRSEEIAPDLAGMGTDAGRWIEAYAREDGWHLADLAHRRLEAWAATMDDDPELDEALRQVRRRYERLLSRMAEGFSQALRTSAWTVPGALHQTRVYPEVVGGRGGRTAYFLVDAMRFEMGVELARRVSETEDLVVRPAVAALPTITPVGMAALLPGASSSFDVVEADGRLAARSEGSVMPGLRERLALLKAKVPDVVEIGLGALVQASPAKLKARLGSARLVVVRSQEIDTLGETGDALLARSLMGTIIGNVARAVRRLARLGVEHFVVTADHGHQFTSEKGEDMQTDSPGGETVEVHRRCWIGRGGATPAGTVRVSGADLGYDTDLEFVFPVGLGVLPAHGGRRFHHGGLSLQELIVPVVSFRIPASIPAEPTAPNEVRLEGYPAELNNRTFGVTVGVQTHLFSQEPLPLRLVLTDGGEQVGMAGMAVGADFDRATGVVQVRPGEAVSVALLLTREDVAKVRVVVQDPATDAVLARSSEIPVKLRM